MRWMRLPRRSSREISTSILVRKLAAAKRVMIRRRAGVLDNQLRGASGRIALQLGG
jgi:hypothetical protein